MSSFLQLTLIAFSIQGLFLALLLAFLPRFRRPANGWLALLVLVTSLAIAAQAGMLSGVLREWPRLRRSQVCLWLAIGPLFYIYLRVAVDSARPLLRRHLLLTLPLFPAAFYVALGYRGLGPFAETVMTAIRLVSNVGTPIYIFLGGRLVGNYARRFISEYSNPDLDRIKWLQTVVWLAGSWVLIDLIVMATLRLTNLGSGAWSAVFGLVWASLLYVLAYLSAADPGHQFVALPPEDPALSTRYTRSALDRSHLNELRQELELLMEESQPHLDPDLTLTTLAEHLGASRHHVSQTINREFGVSYYDFVNGFRVHAAKAIFENAGLTHMNVLDVAFEVGFGSSASFYRAFKRHAKMTPTAYLELAATGAPLPEEVLQAEGKA